MQPFLLGDTVTSVNSNGDVVWAGAETPPPVEERPGGGGSSGGGGGADLYWDQCVCQPLYLGGDRALFFRGL